MARIMVEFEVEIPVDDATDEQVEEWLRFTFGEVGGMDSSNPLSEHDGEAVFGTLRYR